MSSSKRLYLLFAGIIALLFIALIGGAYGANSLLAGRAEKLTAAKAKSQALDQEQLTLAKAKKDIQTYAGLQEITQSVVPEDKDQAEAVREIVNIAAANNVALAAINFPASTLGLVGGSAAGASGTPAPVESSKAASLSQLLAVKNIPGVYQLIINVQGDTNHPVQYDAFINFLGALEHNRRTAQVSSITLQPASTDPNYLTFNLTLNEYIKP